MNSMTPHEDDVLARALRGQVDGMTEAPFSFDDIAGRAGAIRRRRRITVAAGVAAAVAAVLIPSAIMSGSADRSDAPPVVDSPSMPAPVLGELDLTIEGAHTGAAPSVAWVDGDVAHLRDGTAVMLPTLPGGATVSALAELGDNMVVGSRDDEGNAAISVVTREGEILSTEPATGGAALSEDGTVAAYVRPDGTPVLVTAEGTMHVELPAVQAQSPYLRAVSGSAPCGGGCTVWVNDVGQRAAAFRVDDSGVMEVSTTSRVNAVSRDRYIGNVGIREDLFPVDGVWTGSAAGPDWTAEALVGFSPDGRWVVSQFSEGLGASELVILDAVTGEPQVTWRRTGAEGATALGTPVWEDATHLVQVLTQGRDVVIARFGLDGSLELTGIGQQVGDPTMATLFLAER